MGPARAEIIKSQRQDFHGKKFAPVVETSFHYGVKILTKRDSIKMKEDLARPRDLINVENLKKIKKEKGY